jgi:uncharacterized protein (TIGR02145 family)
VICDQIVPLNILGLEYIAIRGFANNNERIYVCGTQDSTILFIDGNPVAVDTIQTAELFKYSFPSGNNTIKLNATKPVHVMHLSGNNNEFGGAILPHDSCTGSRQVGFYRSSSNMFSLMVLTKNGNQDSFYLDGDPTLLAATDFSVVNGTSNAWVYARKTFTMAQLDTSAHLLVNTNGKFHLGILNNLGASSEYGYFSDFSSLYLGADANFCLGDSLVLDGGAYMTSYQWKKLAGGIWIVIDSTRFYTVHDTGYYACMTNGDFCTLMDTIHITYYPNATVSLGNDRTICEGTTTTFDPGLYVTYLWSTGYTGRYLTTGQGGSIWVRVTNNNACIASDTVNLFIDSLPQANHPITGNDTVCQGQQGVSYQVDSLHFATTYAWTLPPGASGTSNSRVINLNFSTSASSGLLKVNGVNACGNGPDTILFITVKNLPGPAGSINSPPEVCQGQNGVVISTQVIQFATSYIWSLPPGATIVSGAGNDTITVDFSLNALSGNISVFGMNECGSGDTAITFLTVYLFPVPAGPINGQTAVCQGQGGVIYTVAPIIGADSYIWTVPPGASITNGTGTSTVTVYFDSTAISGNITVRGHSNMCGDGIPSVLGITVNPLPEPAGAITGPAQVCQGTSGVIYSVAPLANTSTYLWIVPAGVTIISGSGTNQITVSFSVNAQSGLIEVQGFNPICGAGRKSTLAVISDPLPLAAGSITGPTPVCQASSGLPYSIVPVQYADSYIWSYTGGGAAIIPGSTASVSFSATATSGQLFVTPHNSCGDGSISPGFSVTILPIPIVTFTNCTPITSRDGRPFTLKGGIPLGGTWWGTGVVGNTFTPAVIPGGIDSVLVTYSYTNIYSCTASDGKYIRVLPGQPFTCGNVFTDVRDNQTYPTVQIGAQCWMAANLNYGTAIPSSVVQHDNCIPEKYCYNDSPGLCALGSALYQWDELMQYEGVEGAQGLCPPGWHVPSDAEWNVLFAQYLNNGFAGSPLKYTGYSGFNALLTGVRFINKSWELDGFGTFIWTSTSHSEQKAWAHGMNDPDPSVSLYPSSRANAFSVRCIKD